MRDCLEFSERVSEFLILKGWDAKTLAKQIGVTHATALNFLHGTHFPSPVALCCLADCFQCSCQYLLGLTNDYEENKTFVPPTANFGARLRAIMKEANLSQYALTKTYKISGNSVYTWLRQKHLPSVANLIKLADILEVSVDYLIGREN